MPPLGNRDVSSARGIQGLDELARKLDMTPTQVRALEGLPVIRVATGLAVRDTDLNAWLMARSAGCWEPTYYDHATNPFACSSFPARPSTRPRSGSGRKKGGRR